jgi:hypothetical protein
MCTKKLNILYRTEYSDLIEVDVLCYKVWVYFFCPKSIGHALW